MNAALDDIFATFAERKRRKREREAKRNGCHTVYRLDDPLNLALGNWRVPNPGTNLPSAGMTWTIVA